MWANAECTAQLRLLLVPGFGFVPRASAAQRGMTPRDPMDERTWTKSVDLKMKLKMKQVFICIDLPSILALGFPFGLPLVRPWGQRPGAEAASSAKPGHA